MLPLAFDVNRIRAYAETHEFRLHGVGTIQPQCIVALRAPNGVRMAGDVDVRTGIAAKERNEAPCKLPYRVMLRRRNFRFAERKAIDCAGTHHACHHWIRTLCERTAEVELARWRRAEDRGSCDASDLVNIATRGRRGISLRFSSPSTDACYTARIFWGSLERVKRFVLEQRTTVRVTQPVAARTKDNVVP